MTVKRAEEEKRKAAVCLILAGTLVLTGCGATVMIPSDVATAETATAESAEGSMGYMLAEETSYDELASVWALMQQTAETAETALWLPPEIQLDVKNIDQNPELPNGCEITSAAIVLNYLGYSIDKVALSENYLSLGIPYWEADPDVEFMGNPADELAFYCQPGAIVRAVNAYLSDMDSDYKAVDISGSSVEELYEWVANGTPVLVWTTRAFSEPLYNNTFQLEDGSWPYANSHCLVLTGYGEEVCYLADPMLEVTQIDKDTFAERYVQRGKYAMVITRI